MRKRTRVQMHHWFVAAGTLLVSAAAFSAQPPGWWDTVEPAMLLAGDGPPSSGLPALEPTPFYLPPPDGRLRQAEAHFRAGRRLYQAGDAVGARREFDAAIDLLLGAPEDAADRAALEKRLDELIDQIHRLDLQGLGAGESELIPFFDKSPLDEILQMTFPVDPKLRSKVTEEIRATVSQLPLDVNDAVLSYINYFTSQRWRRSLLAGFRKAGRYRQLISRILDEEGVPQELIYLAQAESGFLPRAVSRKRATGMWQFVQARGRQYGLMQSPAHDDRLDPEKATRSAARHLRDLFHQFGDWYLAMAAYNCGPVTVERAVERTGYADFWELRSRSVLPKETSNYVPAILAMVIIGKNLGDYGIGEVDADPPLEYDTVELEAPTHLALVGDLVERSVAELQELNPSLLKTTAPAGFHLRLPKGTACLFEDLIALIPPARRASWRVHRAEAGETLAAVARLHRITPAALVAVNAPAAGPLESGDLVVIPAVPRVPPKAAPRRSPLRTSAGSARSSKASPRQAAQRSRSATPLQRTASRAYHASQARRLSAARVGRP